MMFLERKWHILAPGVFLIMSLPIFNTIYSKSKLIIDEEFHLAQGLQYCNLNFSKWNPKITTFPGLYLISTVLYPFKMCDIFYLRLISLMAATINVVLYYYIRKLNLTTMGVNNFHINAMDSILLSILPPQYFFAFVYYTDTVSLTTVLLFYWYYKQKKYFVASVFGALSILMRQTNVVWLGCASGLIGLDTLSKVFAEAKKTSRRHANPLTISFWREAIKIKGFFYDCLTQIFIRCHHFVYVIIAFLLFVYINGSIAVGDKDAHQLSIHIPQLLYFSVFTALFALNNTIKNISSVRKHLRRNKYIFALLVIILLLIVKYNTEVHPYLLADNRHYTFYIWNRFYGRYNWFRYAMCPIYLICLLTINSGINYLNASIRIFCAFTIMIYLCFQRLLEVRYFLVPFILYRLNVKPTLGKLKYAELFLYIVINIYTFYVFINKKIYWKEYSETQHIIW